MLKRFFLALLMTTAVFALNANEAALKQTIVDYYKAQAELDGNKALSFCHKEYQTTSAKGKTLDYAQVKTLCKAMDIMKKISGPNWTVLDFVELHALQQGKELTPAERELYTTMNNDPTVRKQLEAIVKLAQVELNATQQKIAQANKTIKFISVQINNDKANVVYTMNDFTSGKLEKITADYVKINGKWLVIKEVICYVE